MFFKKLENLKPGDTVKIEYIKELNKRVDFLQKTQEEFKDILKSIMIRRGKNFISSSATEEELLTDIINTTDFTSTVFSDSRFEGNIPDYRQQIPPGEMWLIAKDGIPVNLEIFTTKTADNNQRFYFDDGNGVWQCRNGATSFQKSWAAGSGIQAKDKSFTYHIMKFKSDVEIRGIRPNTGGCKGLLWIITNGITFNVTNYMLCKDTTPNHIMSTLRYLDMLNGGIINSGDCRFSFAYCYELEEINMDFFEIWEAGVSTGMFQDCYKLKKLPEYTIINFNELSDKVFYNCKELQSIPDGIRFDAATDLNYAFYGCTKLKRLNTKNVLTINPYAGVQYAFESSGIEEAPVFEYSYDLDKIYCNYNPTAVGSRSFNACFKNCKSLTKIPPILDVRYAINLERMFDGCSSLIDGPSEIKMLNDNNIQVNVSMAYMFVNCTSLRSFASSITSYNLRYTQYMFQGCSSLKKAPDINAINLLQMHYMFEKCSTLISPPSQLNFPHCIFAQYMFQECTLLEKTPENIILPKVESCLNMFYRCKALVTGPKTMDVSNVNDITNCFSGCTNLFSFESDLVFYDKTNASSFFRECTSLTSVANITGGWRLDSMFYNCKSLISHGVITAPDCISSFELFRGCTQLEVDFTKLKSFNINMNIGSLCREAANTVINVDLNAVFPNARNLQYIFGYCSKLVELNIKLPEKTIVSDNIIAHAASLQKVSINADKLLFVNNCFNAVPSIKEFSFTSDSLETAFDAFGFSNTNLIKVNFNCPKLRALRWGTSAGASLDFLRGAKIQTIDYRADKHIYFSIMNAKELQSYNIELVDNFAGDFISDIYYLIENNMFTAEQLNDLFRLLPDMSGNKFKGIIKIKNNPGTNTCDTSIAEAKNWTVQTV